MSELFVDYRRDESGVFVRVCSSCDAFVPGEPAWTGDAGAVLCSSCVFECWGCAEAWPLEFRRPMGSGVNERDLCIACSDEHMECGSCGVPTYSEDIYSTYTSHGEEYWCDECRMSDGVSHCDGCGDSFSSDSDLFPCRDCGRCVDCVCECESDDDDDDGGCLLSWDYKPRPLFFESVGDPATIYPDPEGVYFGLELEVENTGAESRRDLVEYVSGTLGDLVYVKHDGSLIRGFEIVTHPMTSDYFRARTDFDDVLRGLASRGCRSWVGHRCGFHVHVSRSAFWSRSHLFAFSLFWYRNREHIQRMSGRRVHESERWASLSAHQGDGAGGFPTLIEKVTGAGFSTRYTAVNLTNANTVEIRVFRGSLAPDTIRGCFDLVEAVVEFTRGLTSREIRSGFLSWEVFLRHADATSFPALHALNHKRKGIA